MFIAGDVEVAGCAWGGAVVEMGPGRGRLNVGSVSSSPPACLRFLEASHTVEILRAAGPHGMHVRELSRNVGVDEGKLSKPARVSHCTR